MGSIFLSFMLCIPSAQAHDEVQKEAQAPEVNSHMLVSPLDLNRVLFNGNVMNPNHNAYQASDWMVSFCPHWWGPCNTIAISFDQLGREWEAKVNTRFYQKDLRFGRVDCATDKVLCNEQTVESYPT